VRRIRDAPNQKLLESTVFGDVIS